MYKALDEILFLLFYMVEGYCLERFYGSFLERRTRSTKRTALAVIAGYAGMREIWGIFSVADYENIRYESLRIICDKAFSFLVLLILLVGLYKAVCRMGIFLIITFLAVREIGYMFAYTICQRSYNWLLAFALRYLEKGHLTADGLISVVSIGGYGMIALTCASSALILYFVLKNIARNFRDKKYGIQRRELFFLLAPGMTGLLTCILLRIIMFVVEQEKTTFLYDRYPVLVLIVPLILLLSLLSIPYGVKVFQGLIDLNKEKSSRIILENQISGMQGQIEEMEHIYAGIRSMKHDMQNTISVIMQLAAGADETGTDSGIDRGVNDKIERDESRNRELQEYLAELFRTFEKLEFRYKTGNAVVDTLLNMKYQEICHTLPKLEFTADRLLFPDFLHIQSYDIGVILGNALNNAIEACRKLHEKEKEAVLFIRLSSFRKGNMFFLEVENSFDGELIKKEQEEFPETSKSDKSMHGIGLANIKSAAGKYHGAVDWSADGRIFTLSVMMQNEKERPQ